MSVNDSSALSPTSASSLVPDCEQEQQSLQDTYVTDLTALDAHAILNGAVSRGIARIVEMCMACKHTMQLQRLISLRLDGCSLNHDADDIVHCFNLLYEHGVCDFLSNFEARKYQFLSSGPSSLLKILKNLPAQPDILQSLILHECHVSDAALEFCCKTFPSLTCLDVASNEFLFNVPSAIQLLSHLTELNVSDCCNLSSLPDELLKIKGTLTNISASQCNSVKFPPASVVKGGRHSIISYLEKAQNQDPLKQVKVLFLGNGRSGKTSLLQALARRPQRHGDQGPESTIGVTVNVLEKQLKPSFFERVAERLPGITYWDFAGQLEYSAAHDFFLSTHQAVYAIIFSAADNRDSQVNQVAYWLRTVASRSSLHVRYLIVGTKVDLISGSAGDVQKKLEGMTRDMRSVVTNCCGTSAAQHTQVLFFTAMGDHPHYKRLRKEFKGCLKLACRSIFENDPALLKMLRFPKEYSVLRSIIQKLGSLRPGLPVAMLSSFTGPQYGMLEGCHKNDKTLQALHVLHDVGDIIFCDVENGKDASNACLCWKPQVVADVIAEFADPDKGLPLHRGCASRSTLETILKQSNRIGPMLENRAKQSSDNCVTLFNLLVSLRVIVPVDSHANDKDRKCTSWTSEDPAQFIVPSALKGRPNFWREIIGFQACSFSYIRGIRLPCMGPIITVAAFVRAMVHFCSDPTRLWGCAFSFSLLNGGLTFVRLAESRDFVDVVVLGSSISQLSGDCVESSFREISTRLGCATTHHLLLCPHCCASDMFVRSGSAHAFLRQQLNILNVSNQASSVPADRSALQPPMCNIGSNQADIHVPIPLAFMCQGSEDSSHVLSCSRYHQVHECSVLNGQNVNLSDDAGMPMTYPESSLRTAVPWISVKSTGFAEFVSGRVEVLPNNFFSLTNQLKEGDSISVSSLAAIDDALQSDTQYCRVQLYDVNSTGLWCERELRLKYSPGDLIDGKGFIDAILSCSGTIEVKTAFAASGSVTTKKPHNLCRGDFVMLSISCDVDGNKVQGVRCLVTEIIKDDEMILTSMQAQSVSQLPLAQGVVIMPIRPYLTPSDKALVTYKQPDEANKKARFDLFPGLSNDLQIRRLTSNDCNNSVDAACWRDVENNWAIMFGNEFCNYEITGITFFQCKERERLFLGEVQHLKNIAMQRPQSDFTCSSDRSDVEKSKRAALQMQIMRNFSEFSQKFSLLPSAESTDVNVCVAWWGKWPAVYHGAATNGFWNLPAHLKLDAGYFGEGFYLTRYPRYSDYYVNGFSLSERRTEKGSILMCYAALGRPYPVTQDPYLPPLYTEGPRAPNSPCGQVCGAACGFSSTGGIDSHDSHYVTVKLNPEVGKKSGQYFTCPLRQQPDFDEIVVFNPNRILPTAYVSFSRRRKTILWLDDEPNSPENIRIRSGIPGHKNTQPVFDFKNDILFLSSDSKGIALEDQVDITLFISVDSIEEFLKDSNQDKFIKYPPSLFRIVTNYRLFVGQNGLRARMDSIHKWRVAFPALMVYDSECNDSLHDVLKSRPNIQITQDVRDCAAFVSFQHYPSGMVKDEVIVPTSAAIAGAEFRSLKQNHISSDARNAGDSVHLQSLHPQFPNNHRSMQPLSRPTLLEFCLSLKDAQFDLFRLKIFGFDVSVLKSAGYDASSLKLVGFDSATLKSHGFDALTLKHAGYELSSLKSAGFDAHSLISAGYGVASLKLAGFDALSLKSAGVDLSSLKSAGYDMQSLQVAGAGWLQNGHWNVAKCSLNFESTVAITQELASFSELITDSVDMSGNPELGCSGAVSLMTHIPASVTRLNIGNTGLTDVSQECVDCLFKFANLNYLDISENETLSDSHILLLLSALPSGLKGLNLRGMRLHIQRIKSFEYQLTRLRNLEDLNVSCNGAAGSDRFDSIFETCFRCFPGLQTLDLSNVATLYNVPPKVSLLSNLRILKMKCCENLTSLPDEMETMLAENKLHTVELDESKNLGFPPYRIAAQGFQKIKDYLKDAKNSEPLLKCKVVFMGHFRSGKTSLLRALADLPINADEASGGATAVHEVDDRLQPPKLSMKTYPQLIYWDFAGHLEHSAAHDFFMSNYQAIYVIVFSVMDDREAQVHQVTYWLRTVLSHNTYRDYGCIRFVIVGTKIDLLDPFHAEQELQDIKVVMQRAFYSATRNFALSEPSFECSVSVKFATSLGTGSRDQEMRKELLQHIHKLSWDIFQDKDRSHSRFPKEYSDMTKDIKRLQQRIKDRRQLPLIKLSDQTIITSDYATLFEAHKNDKKKQALEIFGNVGEIMHYTVDGDPWICVQPQFFSSVIAAFADSSSPIGASAFHQDILQMLEDKFHCISDKPCRQKVIDFLLAFNVITRLPDVMPISRDPAIDLRASEDNPKYLIPLALTDWPEAWGQIGDFRNTGSHGTRTKTTIRGLRFTAERVISVSVFLHLMSKRCSLSEHMWGCAFFSKVNEVVNIFVRLSESKRWIDIILLGPPEQSSTADIEAYCQSILVDTGCDFYSRVYLCPQCCQSDTFVSAGSAHAYFLRESEFSSTRMLRCSRHHTVAVDAVKNGVHVEMSTFKFHVDKSATDNFKIVPTGQALLDDLPWLAVLTGAGILQGSTHFVIQRTTYDGHVTYESTSADDDTSVTKHLFFRGTLLPNSFFVLSGQLLVDDVLENESSVVLSELLTHHAFQTPELPVRVLRTTGPSIEVMELSLKMFYSVGDKISHVVYGEAKLDQIESILELNSASEIQDFQRKAGGMLSVHTKDRHNLECGSCAILCFGQDQGGGLCYRVLEADSPYDITFQAENLEANPVPSRGMTILPCRRSFGPNDYVLVIYKKRGKRPMYDVFPGKSNTNDHTFEVAQLSSADCSGNAAVAACWRNVETLWEKGFGTQWNFYEINRITMFRNTQRQKLFCQELQRLQDRGALQTDRDALSVSEDATLDLKQKRLQLQKQTMRHFNEFLEKFSLLPKEDNKDINLSVAWWGKSPATYLNNAQHGFLNLPANVKLDPGYFGEGFYFSQYRRFIDYYISGCSLTSRKVTEGHILLCYAALGTPYPVTQNPFDKDGVSIPPWSLCGKRCGPQCGGADSHDCHYASVKKDPASAMYYPCPLRQQPDIDEIVMFKAERILPVAYVSFQRRRKTLLWLDDHPDNSDNSEILKKIPGARWFDEMEATEQRQVVMRVEPARPDGYSAVRISKATGPFGSAINGRYTPELSTKRCGRPVYRKVSDPSQIAEARGAALSGSIERPQVTPLPAWLSNDMLIVYDDTRQEWQIKDESHIDNARWSLASLFTKDRLEDCFKTGIWKVVPVVPQPGRISFVRNSNAERLSADRDKPTTREDEVDVTLFTSVAAITSFLSDAKNLKFANFPTSLFRILTNRRLFTGTVSVTCCTETEFLCSGGISSLLSPGDRIVFEGEKLFGGVEATISYYLVSTKKARHGEYFSVSKEKGGSIMKLQRQPESPPMFARAPLNSLRYFFETDDAWRLSFPATCVFYGAGQGEDMRALLGRPNFVATKAAEDSIMFVQFEPMTLLQECD